jgi:predicted nucleotidyltransferase
MTSLETIVQKIRTLKPELVSRYYVSSIGLFGSVVRDDFVPSKSDVDIIVDFSRPVGIEFIDLAEFLERNIDRKVDLVSLKGIKQKYYDQISKEIIYV